MKYTFSILGKPQAKQRPKVYRKGNHAIAVTPKPTIAYEQIVKLRFMELYDSPLEGNIKASFVFYFAPNKQESTKKFLELISKTDVYYAKKPDCDNLAKSILDALNTIAYHDDSQIVELYVKKMYSIAPRVEVTLETL